MKPQPREAAPDAASKETVRPPAPPRKRVRHRLLALVLVCVTGVLVVGVPGILASVRDLAESQRLQELGALNGRAVVLSHLLADERDQMALFIAQGRSTASGAGISEDQRARVDRQAKEVSDQVVDGDPATDRQVTALRKLLATLPTVRQQALSGPGSATTAFSAYTKLIDGLDALAVTVAARLPAHVDAQDIRALPDLARAVNHASAQRGLLLVALTSRGSQSTAIGAARQSLVRETAALAEFEATASESARAQYAETVTGEDVDDARTLVRRMTDQDGLSSAGPRTDRDDFHTLLTTRIERIRGVEASLAAATADQLRATRDSTLVELKVHIALTALVALLVLSLTVRVSHSLTRPLARLRRAAFEVNGRLLPVLARQCHGIVQPDGTRGASAETADPRPVVVSGCGEFREIAKAMDDLQELAVRVCRENSSAQTDRAALADAFQALANERDALLRREKSLLEERDTLKGNLHNTFVNLSMRTLSLVERQLALIETLENREQDPEQLESLFQLDHLATRMRRNGENLLVLAGVDTSHHKRQPVPLLDVLRAAISEIERYQRVSIRFLPRVLVAGRAADDVSHLVAELLENATAFSPPEADVEVNGWVLENGEVMLSVVDHGIGIPPDRLATVNEQLAAEGARDDTASRSMGLFVVGRLAHRYGIRVRLREAEQGLTAVVALPTSVLIPQSPAGPALPSGDAPAGSRAETMTAAPVTPGSGQALGEPSGVRGAADSRPGGSGASRRASQPVPRVPSSAAPPAGRPALEPSENGSSPLPKRGRREVGTPPADREHTRPEGEVPPLPVRRPRPASGDEATAGQPSAERSPSSGAPSQPYTAVEDGPTQPPRGEGASAADEGTSSPGKVTRVGLPKRVPQANALPGAGGPSSQLRREGAAPVRGSGAAPTTVDAAELRRKLGGFQWGLREGRREAEALVPRSMPVSSGQATHSSSTPSTPEDGEDRG